MNDLRISRQWNWKRTLFGLFVVSAGLVTIADACDRNHNEDNWMAHEPEYCSCQGTTLHCSHGGVDDFADSKYCDPKLLDNAGVCVCEGSDLTCEYNVYVVYSDKTPTPNATLTFSTPLPNNSGKIKVVFANSEYCANVTATETEAPTEVSTEQPTEVVSQPTTPPEICSAAWLPESGCTCCGSTLVCADGSRGDFNPQCTGGGVEPTACPVGMVCP